MRTTKRYTFALRTALRIALHTAVILVWWYLLDQYMYAAKRAPHNPPNFQLRYLSGIRRVQPAINGELLSSLAVVYSTQLTKAQTAVDQYCSRTGINCMLDFSATEGILLYLILRERKPSAVLQIGLSVGTVWILYALFDNQQETNKYGMLYSFARATRHQIDAVNAVYTMLLDSAESSSRIWKHESEPYSVLQQRRDYDMVVCNRLSNEASVKFVLHDVLGGIVDPQAHRLPVVFANALSFPPPSIDEINQLSFLQKSSLDTGIERSLLLWLTEKAATPIDDRRVITVVNAFVVEPVETNRTALMFELIRPALVE